MNAFKRLMMGLVALLICSVGRAAPPNLVYYGTYYTGEGYSQVWMNGINDWVTGYSYSGTDSASQTTNTIFIDDAGTVYYNGGGMGTYDPGSGAFSFTGMFGVDSDGVTLLGVPAGVTVIDPAGVYQDSQGRDNQGWGSICFPFLSPTANAWVTKYIFPLNTIFSVDSSPLYVYLGPGDVTIDGRSGWNPSNIFTSSLPQYMYINGRSYSIASTTPSVSGVSYSEAITYVDATTGQNAGIDRYFSGGVVTGGDIWGSVNGQSFSGSFDPNSWQVSNLQGNVAISFSAPSGTPSYGPPLVSWDNNLLQFFYTTADGKDLYWAPDSGDNTGDYTAIVAQDDTVTVMHGTVSATGTCDPATHALNFGGTAGLENLFALDSNGDPIGLPAGLTLILGAGGFGDSVLLADGVHTPTYTYRRPGGTWGKKYVGLSGNYWFLVADNVGNYNSQLYVTSWDEMVVNAASGWPVSNAYPAQVYVNGIICPLHWETQYVGGTIQNTYGGASYISADNTKTITLNWSWNSGASWGWSMNSQSGAWDHADAFANLPVGTSVHLDPPPTAPSYGPARLKLNGVELMFQGLASQDAGADVYSAGGKRLTIQSDGKVTVTDESTGYLLLTGYYNASTHVIFFWQSNSGTVVTMDDSGNVLGTSQSPAIASGAWHNVVVRANGTVWTWGSNQYGQLGNGANVTSDVPVQVPGFSGAIAVAAGQNHTLVLKSDGTVWTWGLNSKGQLGNNSTTDSNVPVQVSGLTGIVGISAGALHSLAVKADGTVWSWGWNFNGQLGNNSTTDSHVPVQVSGLNNAILVSGGYNHSLAMKSDGTIWSWGNNGYGQLGDASNTSSTTPVQAVALNNTLVAGAGGQFSLALRSDGTVWAWGLGSVGQLGNNATVGSNFPVGVNNLNGVVAVVAGSDSHALAIQSGGNLWAWGRNQRGQQGNYTGTNSLVPVPVYGVNDPVALAAGLYHSVAATSNGNVFTWGDDSHAELGNINFDLIETPVQILSPTNIVAMSAGMEYSLAVTDYGQVYAWGTGHLGEGGYTTRLTPFPIWGPWSDVVIAVASGFEHSLALSRDGNVYAWGDNSNGQLGNNSTLPSSIPVQVSAIANVTQIGAGESHSVCLKSDGTVWTWGYNADGELGNNSTTISRVPVQVNGLTGITAIATHTVGYHTLALKNDGTVWAWGANWSGELGNNSGVDSSVPVQVSGLSNVVAIAAAFEHSLALKSDGTVWAWGYNGEGELGNNSTNDSWVPVQVPGLTGVVKIGAGSYHSAVVKSDGTLWTWGGNWSGQLGNGTTTDSLVPVLVNGVMGVKALSCGDEHTLALKEDGTLESWGNATYGALGVGWGNMQASPTVVLGLNLLHPAPQVAFTTPLPNTSVTVAMGQVAQLQFSTTPGDSAVNEIQVWSEGISLGSVYGWNEFWWYPPTWGDYVLTAVAVDQNGATSARSAPVTVHVPFDSDGNGLPDWWEMKNFGHLGVTATGVGSDPDGDGRSNLQEYHDGTDPNDYYNGQQVVITIVSGDNQVAVAGTPLAAPLVVQVTDTNGTPLNNAPVTFSSPQYATFSTVTNGGFIYQLTERSDASGQITAYCTLPPSPAGPYSLVAATASQNVHASATFTATDKVAAPVFSPASGTYPVTQTVSIASATPGATIHYTTNGAEPTQDDPVLSLGARLAIRQTTTLKARAWYGDYTPSDVTTAVYKIAGQLIGGGSHTVGIRPDGALWAWGANESGQLGDSTTTQRLTPVPVPSLLPNQIVAVAAGDAHTIAIKEDGTLWTWGKGSDGQLGLGTTNNRSLPVQVPGLSGVLGAAARGGFTLTVDSLGRVWAFGKNDSGQLGPNATLGINSPVPIVVMWDSPTAVAAGAQHSLVLKNNGTVWSWGQNSSGQLGNGTTSTGSTPVQASGLTNVIAIAAGNGHSIALESDGSVWVWGSNVNGQLGLGDTSPRNTPTQITTLAGVIAIAAGDNHSIFLKADGTVWTCGLNDNGQLGDSTITQRSVPTQVSGLSDIVAIGAGNARGLAIKADLTFWGWGANTFGQLGDGTTTSPRTTPVQINPMWDDNDGDGLNNYQESQLGTNPNLADTNGDGLTDLEDIQRGLSPTSLDIDGDGISNADEIAHGTNPFLADTDGDGVPDALDAFPLDPTRTTAPAFDPNDHTKPTVTLLGPVGATLVEINP